MSQQNLITYLSDLGYTEVDSLFDYRIFKKGEDLLVFLEVCPNEFVLTFRSVELLADGTTYMNDKCLKLERRN